MSLWNLNLPVAKLEIFAICLHYLARNQDVQKKEFFCQTVVSSPAVNVSPGQPNVMKTEKWCVGAYLSRSEESN